MSLKLLVASTLLLLLCSEVLSNNMKKRGSENRSTTAQIQEAVKKWLNYFSDGVYSLAEKVKSWDVSQEVWKKLDHLLSAAGTYKDIFVDQVLYLGQN